MGNRNKRYWRLGDSVFIFLSITMRFISVDLQNDFATEWWFAYQERPSVDFIKKTLIPYFKENNIECSEIMSDYRLPSKKSNRSKCVPWTWWFESILPNDIKYVNQWVKSMHSPIRIRKNWWISAETSYAYPDPRLFETRLRHLPNNENTIILFWLTLDCCILSAAQEFSWRWYDVYILEEWVDLFDWDQIRKKEFLKNNTRFRAKTISFDTLWSVKQTYREEVRDI